MKTLICDFCNAKADLARDPSPYGWKNIKVEVRAKNIGVTVLKLDACKKCACFVDRVGSSRDKVIEFLKSIEGSDDKSEKETTAPHAPDVGL